MLEHGFNFHEEYITDVNGKRTKVILDFAEYQKLIEFLEDLYDLQAIKERQDEPLIPHDQFVKLLKEDGLL